MYSFTDSRAEGDVRVDVAFTDAALDLQGPKPGFAEALAKVEADCGVSFARLAQVHGDEVLEVDEPVAGQGDALVTTRRGLGLMVRAADCVPVLLADAAAGVAGAVHAGRVGVSIDVVGRAVERMRSLGAGALHAWVGPHVCGRCYEVPADLRDEVAAVVPETWAETSWGTPSLDLGAGVAAQLAAREVTVTEVGRCTLEDPALHSYRRDGAASGRLAGLVWLT